LPQRIELAGQYKSQPQQMRSGLAGLDGNFFTMADHSSGIHVAVADMQAPP